MEARDGDCRTRANLKIYCSSESFQTARESDKRGAHMTNPIKTSTPLPSATGALTTMCVVLLIALCPSALAVATPPPASANSSESNRVASAARTLNATDTAHLHYVHSSGSSLFETGTATGTLPGSMQAHVNIGPTISGNFTIDVRGGSISGHGTGTPHGSGTYESFSGSLTVTGGTGRYTHAHGRAGLYGTFNRKTYALVVQTTGRLSY
jgi:hypothetical protein